MRARRDGHVCPVVHQHPCCTAADGRADLLSELQQAAIVEIALAHVDDVHAAAHSSGNAKHQVGR